MEVIEKAALVWSFRQAESGQAEVLLIHKKRGLGAGKVNAPGGRLEQGESWAQAASRELKEETGAEVNARDLVEVAQLAFKFLDGYQLDVRAFFAGAPVGDLVETDEAIPFWCPVSSIPWNRMWKDDSLWLPPCLVGQRVQARFLFDGEAMLEADVRTEEWPIAPIIG